ncbi:hypothetical protein [Pseudofrankia inefficax]|uniref:Uncharacterized protein n=1 Tax=Pseudofrankia inefficax (strain DSM 45817 / CECT 9037 / DDB 130130 / EuI1c) TaxID=298654 RepID=E3IZI9_PSEI1|nr:hypothetical protein [Pseudofrankia inefficax]ADP82759.1 hypothetical protein FraEuI1c_4769 [Pseudofrankia inefficax]
MPDDRGSQHQVDPDQAIRASSREAPRPSDRSALGRRFFLADPRAQTGPGRVRLAEIAAELVDPDAARRWYQRLDLEVLGAIATPHGQLTTLLAGEPPAGGAGRGARQRVRAVLEGRGLGWLCDDDERGEHAERAWDALYAAHYGVDDAVGQVECLTQVLAVCRLAELAYSSADIGWRELADAASARPMVPAEIYRPQRDRRQRPPDQVVQAVAMPVARTELDRVALDAALDSAALRSGAEEA